MALKQKMLFLLEDPGFFPRFIRLKYNLWQNRLAKKSIWVFQCDFIGHFPYLKPYYDILASDKFIEVYFSIGVRDTEKSPASFLVEQGVPPDRIIEPADYVALLDFDLYLSPTEWGNIFPKNENCVRAQVFHTLADKGLEYSDELLNFNTIFMNGPLHHKFMDKYIFSKYPQAKINCHTCNVGFAKIDELFDGRYSRNDLLRNLGVHDGLERPVVLYAPNWESTSALHKYGEDVFSKLQQSGHIILIKLHYMSLLSPDNIQATGGIDWWAVMEKYSTFENVCIIDDTNINPYLFLADIMVTDYGGASFEFMTMDKPIVYFDCPGFFDERGHHIFEKEARSTGHLINDVDQLQTVILDALQYDSYKEQRQKIASQLLYNKGCSARAGINALKQRVQKIAHG